MKPLSQDKQSSKRQPTDTLGESSQLKKAKRSKSSCKSVNLVLGSSNSCYDLGSLVVAQSDADHLLNLLEKTLSTVVNESKKSTELTVSTTGAASASSSTAPSSSSSSSSSEASSSSSSGVKRLLYFGVNETVKAVGSAKCQLIALTNPSNTHLQFALVDVCREARVPLILVPNLSHLRIPGISRVTVIGVKKNTKDTSGIVEAFTRLVTPYGMKLFAGETDDVSRNLLDDVSKRKFDSSSASITDAPSFLSVVKSLKSQGKGQTAGKRKRDLKRPK